MSLTAMTKSFSGTGQYSILDEIVCRKKDFAVLIIQFGRVISVSIPFNMIEEPTFLGNFKLRASTE